MKVYTTAPLEDPRDVRETFPRLEGIGYDGGFSFEAKHDPFLPIAVAAEHTKRLRLGTGIAIAFARSPMNLAYLAHGLQSLCGGRFVLGLGSQVRPHIEKRFGMTWSRPAARMRELVQAIRAIWQCWSEGGRLDFRGEFYTHTLMTPMFSPGRNPHGDPPIFLAGVGPAMTRVAGEVADGFFVHPFHTEKSVREVTLPALERGFGDAGRSRKDLQLSFQIMIASGQSDEETLNTRRMTKQQIAFYGSTPAYRVVLDAHGQGDLQPELNALSKQGRWTEMAELVSDDLLEAIAVCCPMDQVARRVRARCGDVADRVSLVAHWARDPAPWADVARELRASA